MKTTGQTITEIIEAYGDHTGWMRISGIAQAKGLTPAEIQDAVDELLDDPGFSIEAFPMRAWITEADKAYGPMVDGEQRHSIRWS